MAGLVYSIIHTAILERIRGRYNGYTLVGVSVLLGIGLTVMGALLHGLFGELLGIVYGLTSVVFMTIASAIIGLLSICSVQ